MLFTVHQGPHFRAFAQGRRITGTSPREILNWKRVRLIHLVGIWLG